MAAPWGEELDEDQTILADDIGKVVLCELDDVIGRQGGDDEEGDCQKRKSQGEHFVGREMGEDGNEIGFGMVCFVI